MRVDEEHTHPLGPDEEAALLAAVEGAVAEADAVILSDYGKGVLAPKVLDAAIACARGRGVPVYVDPKGDDFARYTRCDLHHAEPARAGVGGAPADIERCRDRRRRDAGAARQRYRVPCSRPARKKAWR